MGLIGYIIPNSTYFSKYSKHKSLIGKGEHIRL